MNSESTPKGLPRRVGQVWVRREDDEAAIYDPMSGSLHRLNPSALAIWELCDGRTSIAEMGTALAEVTNMPEQQATADIARTVNELQDLGLLE